MKAAVIGAKYDSKFPDTVYKNIAAILSQSGANVDMSYFSTSLEDDRADIERAYERNQKLVKGCDLLIADTTNYSSGIGFLIANTLNNKKPVIAIYNNSLGKHTSGILKASAKKSKFLTFLEYSNEKELKDLLTKSVRDTKQILDTKFILIISPEIDRYITWASENKRMHKAQVVRQAIEDMIGTDKEYKKTLG